MTEKIEDYRAEYVIDACQYANWNRTIFEQMREGGVTCVNATIAYWENTRETLTRIAEWRRLFAANTDLIIKNTDSSNDVYIVLDAGTASTSVSDGIKIAAGHSWFGNLPNTTVADIHAISSSSTVTCIVAALLDDVG